MNKQINTLLQKEMNRKEFLATMGFGVASIFGLSTILQVLGGKPSSLTNHRKSTFGYGSSPYGR